MSPGFRIGGIWWRVEIVPPSSPALIDRTRRHRLATTDPAKRCISVSSALCGGMLDRVLIHEAAHAAMESYGITESLKRYVLPRHQVEVEEMICNMLADHGNEILNAGMSASRAIKDMDGYLCMIA